MAYASVGVAQQGLSLITYPPAGEVLTGDSTTIYFGPGASPYDEWRITFGIRSRSADIYDSGVRRLNEDPWEYTFGRMPSNGAPVVMTFWQRVFGGSWATFDTVYQTEVSGGTLPPPVVAPPVNTPVSNPAPVTSPSTGGAGLANITYPFPGDILSGDTTTIYFGPGSAPLDEWRITMGTTPSAQGLYDSGVKNLNRNPWEQQFGRMPDNGLPVYLRYWQRVTGQPWQTFDVVYGTQNLGPSTPPVTPPPVTPPVVSPQPTTPVTTPPVVIPPPSSSEGLAIITYPEAGAELNAGGATIYFVPGSENFEQWRITVGTNADGTGLHDSGVRSLSSDPWEYTFGQLPSGRVINVRFWQRQSGGPWQTNMTAYRTTGAPPIASPPATTPPVISPPVAPPVTAPVTPPPTNNGETVRSLTAVHRHGQTFLTWTEMTNSASYHVYRHSSPITSSNLSAATRLTNRWGPLGADTSVNFHAKGPVPGTYRIADLQPPLSDRTGLFVHTARTNSAAYYAVTSVVNGIESRAISAGNNSLQSSIGESISTPRPVLTSSLNGGRGRVYTQFMDYADWNPTLNGYAYNYAVALPQNYDPSRSYPLLLELHAYGESYGIEEQAQFGWQVIQLFPSDPGSDQGSTHSWWYGYSADHNYKTGGQEPVSGRIANFTERRVMQAVREVIDNPELNVNRQLVHAFGHSMGGSGAFGFGLRYGNVFSGIYGSEGMTNYRSNPLFQGELASIWGSQATNLPIINRGPDSGPIQRYDGIGVWDWMNHQKQLVDRRTDRMAYLMLGHGKADDVIDWTTQGEPLIRAFTNAKAGFSARSAANFGHSWLGFTATVHTLFGFGNDTLFEWRYPLDLSFPAIQNASASGSLFPGVGQTDEYNLNIEWATPHTPFAPTIVDQPGRYEISLRSLAGNQVADITPRRTAGFSVIAGERCNWSTRDNNNGRLIASGVTTVASDALLTVDDVSIRTGSGTLLAINCP